MEVSSHRYYGGIRVGYNDRLSGSVRKSIVVQGGSVDWRQRVWRGVQAMGHGLLGLFIALAVALRSDHDPVWEHSGDGGDWAHPLGAWGAHFGDLLYVGLGPCAFLLSLYLFLRALPLWPQARASLHGPLLRVASLLLALVATAALARLHFYQPAAWIDDAAGGLVGGIVGMAAWHVLGLPVATLLLLSAAFLGWTLALDLPWLDWCETIGAPCDRALVVAQEATWGRMTRSFQYWRQQRALRREFLQQEDANFTLHISNRRVQEQLATEVPPPEPAVVAKPARKKSAERPRQEPVFEEAAEASAPPWGDHIDALEMRAPRSQPDIQPVAAPVALSPRAERERQSEMFAADEARDLPAIALLDPPDTAKKRGYSPETLEGLSRLLEIKLREFGIDAEVKAVQPGPVITRFEIQPAAGVKVARISNIAKDLARSLAVISVRVVEVIPGKSVVGIEIPNEVREMVRLSEVLSSVEYDSKESPLTLVLGKDIGGRPVVADLARMPHLLVAGTTGSGKSVGVNAMILSILYKATPAEVRMIMIDPKMLELSIYDGIPHLLTPVVTDMKEAANALRWSVAEMERRYKLLAAVGVRNLAGYNKKVLEMEKAGTPLRDPLWRRQDSALEEGPSLLSTLPAIVIVVDEFADMMMVVGKKVEELIARIAQKARAAGIHLILATQRPSVDVITGLIKANIPTRIAFQVSSRIDSRTILDQGGAEQLLGQGDMLFLPPGTGLPERVHGAFVADEEVHRVCSHWRSRGAPAYIEAIVEGSYEVGDAAGGDENGDGDDPEQDALYDQALAFVLETRRASASFVQRRFKIGYNRAARLIEAMENAGVVGAMGSNGQREILLPRRE